MSEKLNTTVAVIGIDIGKNAFHVVGLDARGAIVLRQKWSRGQVETRPANMPPCLIGMEAFALPALIFNLISGIPAPGNRLNDLILSNTSLASQLSPGFSAIFRNSHGSSSSLYHQFASVAQKLRPLEAISTTSSFF
jgi:hypothetical protein